MGLALLFIIWLITLSSTYYFVIQKWAPLPVASANGVLIDHHFTWTYILMGIVFLAAQLGLGYLVWRYRDRGQKVQYSHGNTTMEVTWTLLTAILFMGLNLSGEKIWAEARFQGAAPGAVQVEVTGLQFAWYFRYPGPDGKLGHTKPELEDASVGNPVGIDPDDPASKDDVVTGTMYLPVEPRSRGGAARAGRDPQLLHSCHALQAGRRSRLDDPHALHSHQTRRLRDCLRRALRPGTLQDARHLEGRQPGGLRQVAGRQGGGETIAVIP